MGNSVTGSFLSHPVGGARAGLHLNVEDVVHVRLQLLPDRVQLRLERISLERANHVHLDLLHVLHVAGPFYHLRTDATCKLALQGRPTEFYT